MTRAGERGSASVLVVSHLAVLLVLGCALAAVGGLVVAHRQAQSAADLAALTGATAVSQGGSGCAAAARAAVENGARLSSCHGRGREVRVRVEVDGPAWFGRSPVLRAQARAGPG